MKVSELFGLEGTITSDKEDGAVYCGSLFVYALVGILLVLKVSELLGLDVKTTSDEEDGIVYCASSFEKLLEEACCNSSEEVKDIALLKIFEEVGFWH